MKTSNRMKLFMISIGLLTVGIWVNAGFGPAVIMLGVGAAFLACVEGLA